MKKTTLIVIILAVIIGAAAQYGREKVSVIKNLIQYSDARQETEPLVIHKK